MLCIYQEELHTAFPKKHLRVLCMPSIVAVEYAKPRAITNSVDDTSCVATRAQKDRTGSNLTDRTASRNLATTVSLFRGAQHLYGYLPSDDGHKDLR